MKLFKTTEEKIAELGFVKEEESKICVSYIKHDTQFNYTQIVELCHKSDPATQWVLNSYQKGTNSEGFNNCVGLSSREVKLFYKKAIKKWGKVK